MRKNWWLVLVLAALFVVRLDLWWWRDPSLVLGLPIGLVYQVVFCLLVVVVMAGAVRFAWPQEVGEGAAEGASSQGGEE